MKRTIIIALSLFLMGTSATSNAQITFKSLKDKLTENENSQGSESKQNSSTSSTSTSNVSSEKPRSNANDSPIFAKAGREWYVSKSRGTGQAGTKEQPAKDLGNIIHLLKPNDIIYIAEGEYLSKGSRGADEINVPVKIYGGYDENFVKRDPWGAHKSVFTGTNEYMKLTDPRIYIRTDQQREATGQLSTGSEIVVDGIIINNGPRNRYHEDKNLAIRRQASPNSGRNPSPESGGIVIVPSHFTIVTVQNCVVMNTAPTEGAISVRLFKGGKGLIQNNLSINNTGYGIQLRTGYVGSDQKMIPEFVVRYNTSLFSWKHDAVASYGGDALAMDNDLKVLAEYNVFGFGDFGGIYSKGANLTLNNNLFTGNSKYDYKEINAKMKVSDLLDESAKLNQASTGNESALIRIDVAERWAKIYGSRVEISRESVDAASTASNSGSNQLRSMLGLNVQGNDVAMDAEIFLPKMELEEGISAGFLPWNGKGCSKPTF